MGIKGEMVRSVFSGNRSAAPHESNARSSTGDKRRWSSIRTYLCGDEFNSVLAEEDSSSIKSSETTVTQPKLEDSTSDIGDIQRQETTEAVPKEKHNSTLNLFRQDDAAIIIQSAFRNFLARRKSKEIKLKDDKQELELENESPSRDSAGTSIEVQTGNSVEVLSVREENVVHQRMQKKARTQVLKLKEDWDDSTISSNVLQMRIKNRLEATNRRERALAYAFSQQLRISSKKNQTRSDGAQPNISWSWIERWMATRAPENSIESHTGKQLEPKNNYQKLPVGKRYFDTAVEEKESCGSNEISVQFDNLSMASVHDKDGFKPAGNKLKATRNISRRKTVPSHHWSKENVKVTENDCSKVIEEDKELKQKQPAGCKNEIKWTEASS